MAKRKRPSEEFSIDPFSIDPSSNDSVVANPADQLTSAGRALFQDPTITFKDQHYAQLYTEPPDFKDLARRDPEFAELWDEQNPRFFNDPQCVMQLTKTLLKLDFNLELEMPDDRLCPPVTNRHNYVLWLKNLLDTTSYEKPGRELVGLDIGTGASCIYPLLGCTQRPWNFIATDIDNKSIDYARKNIKLNNFEERIRIVQRKREDALIPLDDLNIQTIDFTMSNPPFYSSKEQMLHSAAQKSRPPFTACTGAESEMVTDGGEVSFVDRMLQESLVLRERVQWYTSMFGFLKSLVDFVQKLKEKGIENYAVTEFVQGKKTRRWAVAWSFGPMRPRTDVSRGLHSPTSKNILPAITEADVITIAVPEKIGLFADSLNKAISELELVSWIWDTQRLEGIGRAADRVWGRAWRRRKKRGIDAENEDKTQKKPVFGFSVSVRVGTGQAVVSCRWLEGHDAVAFESFQGYLKTTVKGVIE